ncbi:hypothetical protein BDZ88DRAFT_439902 [Geranomyces variabilis]|nr:hypothetical protein BDZ88DRAFT_439902 [Geranomyces variabilis]
MSVALVYDIPVFSGLDQEDDFDGRNGGMSHTSRSRRSIWLTELSIKIDIGALRHIAALLLSDAITVCHIVETKKKAKDGAVFRSANQLAYGKGGNKIFPPTPFSHMTWFAQAQLISHNTPLTCTASSAGRMEPSDVCGAFFARAVRVYLRATPAYQRGRMMRDGGNFDQDLIKVVNTVAAAATVNWLARYLCHRGFDYISNGHLHACAFGPHHASPYSLGMPKTLTSMMDIGRRGIEIAALGGFDKITWDGASDEFGFVTYFSAGFKMHQIADAVLTGVDAIGIGGAQGTWTTRPAAEKSIRGRGVALLCRLDRMYYEQREDYIKRAIKKSSAVAELSHDGEAPFTGQARRLIAAERPLLKSFAKDNQQ